MTVATDPKTDTLEDSDDEFSKHFDEFAAAKIGLAPDQEEQKEPGEPEGNGPDEPPAAPAKEEEEPSQAATEESGKSETATSGDAEPEGGGQPPEGEQAPDLWANAPEELKAEYAKIQKERDEARHKAQSDASRVAALSKKLQQLSAISSAPAPEQPTEAQKALDEKVDQLRKDYGEIADPLIELIENQRKELTSVRATLTGLSEERQAQVIAAETQALEARHPDWQSIAQSPDFAGWLQIQPPNIQSLAASWDARETSVVLTLFKAEQLEATGQTAEAPQETKPKADAATGARRSQQLDGGRDVRSKPAPAASEAPDDFDAAFKFFAEKRRLREQAQARR